MLEKTKERVQFYKIRDKNVSLRHISLILKNEISFYQQDLIHRKIAKIIKNLNVVLFRKKNLL